MRAFLWEQDADGKDLLTETNDLIFFPKIIIFEKPEERKVARLAYDAIRKLEV
mgnify:CR=1 FL=1